MAESNSKVFPIKLSSEFTEITKKGRKVRASSYLTLILLDSKDDLAYFGTTVSKKVGSAVVRNKLKRWVRNCVRSAGWSSKFKSKKVVFMFRPQPEGFYKKLKYSDFVECVLA
ncbi:ribonuclease P protein component [Pseudobdellovibrio sp. HCB154]|uniref:ribonuclease P protein component n=1 Tax=Pseudobdellovibrio sp. HCB154 TaxID=3386277 RepID=UPI003917405A